MEQVNERDFPQGNLFQSGGINPILNQTRRELRFILLQDCNYKCVFCHEEGAQEKHKKLLTPDDIAYLYEVGQKNFGFETTTLSGGEPLVHKDILEITEKLKDKGAKITMVTNGSRLSRIPEISSNIDRFNISIHSFDDEEYTNITRTNETVEGVINGMILARRNNPNVEIRINQALVRGQNTDKGKILECLYVANSIGASVKFMELYGGNPDEKFSLDELRSVLLDIGCQELPSDNPRQVVFTYFASKIIGTRIFCADAEIDEDPSGFCNRNNDVFVMPDGKIKPCRESSLLINILEPIKKRNTACVIEGIRSAISLLGAECQFNTNSTLYA